MEVLQEIARKLRGELRRIDFRALTLRLSFGGKRKLGEETAAGVDEAQEIAIAVARHRIVTLADIGEVARKERAHLLEDEVPAWPFAPVFLSLLSRLHLAVPARDEIVAHIPGNSRALPAGIFDAL